jgi:hypothetical protein
MSHPLELSVVLPTDTLDTIGETLRHLARQTARERIELVIVTSADQELALPDSLRATFGAAQVVEVGNDEMVFLHRARAAGIRAARAPVVVLAETHSFPEPDWADALIETHRGPWAAVGPAMICGNPGPVSWANFYIDFGPWIERRHSETMARLPGHNASYKRDVLLAYGSRLEEMLESEWHLHADLRREGHELRFEPAARTHHLNVVGRASLRARYDHGRLWAVGRAAVWPMPRRLLYVLGAPLIPFRRFPAVFREVRRTGRARDVRLLALIWVELAADAVGELVGYVRGGEGPSSERFTESELHRVRYAGALAAAGSRGMDHGA